MKHNGSHPPTLNILHIHDPDTIPPQNEQGWRWIHKHPTHIHTHIHILKMDLKSLYTVLINRPVLIMIAVITATTALQQSHNVKTQTIVQAKPVIWVILLLKVPFLYPHFASSFLVVMQAVQALNHLVLVDMNVSSLLPNSSFQLCFVSTMN